MNRIESGGVMMSRTSTIGFTLLLGSLLSLTAFGWLRTRPSAAPTAPPPAATPQVEARPKKIKLFSIAYGEKDHQLMVDPLTPPAGLPREGMLGIGPTDFCVSWDGNLFYFLDIGNEQDGYAFIKVFNRRGELVQKIKCERDLLRGRIAVAPNGTIYLRWGGDFAVFDAQGAPQKELVRRLAEQYSQAREAGITTYSDYLTTDLEGNLYMRAEVNEAEKTLRLNIAPGSTYILLPAGVVDRRGYIWDILCEDPVEMVPRRVLDIDGSLIYETNVVAFKKRRVTVYDKDGNQLREFWLPAGEVSELERSLTFGVGAGGGDKIDGRGYLFVALEPRELRWYPITDDGEMRVLRSFVVMEYDAQGRRIGKRAEVGMPDYPNPDSIENVWDVDRLGNLYYLEFKKDQVEVWLVPPLVPVE